MQLLLRRRRARGQSRRFRRAATGSIARRSRFAMGSFVVLLLLPLIYIAICAVGYYMGTKRLAIMSKLVYKDDKKKPNKKNPQ